ncbi:hypothetical protein HH308_07770 [Gordonia sp. TBRC 11910]|uniref:DUF6351 domain-containing protein n=1 Tax=Gordonia asplenii TaxID=2725283 RepID=A0A848KXD6_9ACTN|nr:DUF6351 family protein [Gordonia asplenii]NMO01113.1 hypothetical protein [Gordonia asplenii]
MMLTTRRMPAPLEAACATVTLRVLSAQAGFVTGGTALIEVSPTEPATDLRLTLNGADATAQLAPAAADGTRRGVLRGFVVGENRLVAESDGGQAVLVVTDYPTEGPLFSGPHLQPWSVTTEANGLGPATDEYGNAPSHIDYHYLSSRTESFETYDLGNPPRPDEIATTTTDTGHTVPYVVRREIGAANRGIFELAVLCDPDRPWSAVSPQPGWNHKLWIYAYGGWNQMWSQSSFNELARYTSVDDTNAPAPNINVFNDIGLRRGFMVARTTLMQSRTNSDPIRAAESLVMLKEHIIKNYGTIRYTFASGASGGSIMQQMIANQYPGILQGIIPMSSLHSTWYLPGLLNECRLLERYFTQVSPTLWRDASQRLAVDGHRSEEVRDFFNTVFDTHAVGGNTPTRGTGLPDEVVYHPIDNPGGARGTLQDYQVNYLGRRPESQWTASEREAGRGFAHLPWDNTGTQYGLRAMLDNAITVEQFVDLNEHIGGVDIDNAITATRTEADPQAMARLHRTGLVNDFTNLDTVAILDLRNPEFEDPIRSHTQFHTWVTRAGLTDAHGHADNHVAWIVPGFATGSTPTDAAFSAMDRWLAAVEGDTDTRPLAEKIAVNRPADVVDGIWSLDGHRTGDLDDYNRRFPSYGDATLVAACGDLSAYRTPKPQLKPLDRADYGDVEFTDAQWERMRRTFPNGVADWSKAGIGATAAVPWLTYRHGPDADSLFD